MTQPNKDNPSVPSTEAQTKEQIHRSTQENQDWNRPDQNQKGQQGQKRVLNDSSSPGFGSDQADGMERTNGQNNADDRIDDLGDSK
jgi:hypothetical protein